MALKFIAADFVLVVFSAFFVDFLGTVCFTVLAVGCCEATGGGGGGSGGGCEGGGGGGGRSLRALATACRSLDIGGTGGGVDLLTLVLAVGKGLDFAVYALLVSFATSVTLEGCVVMGVVFLSGFFLAF